MRTIDNVIISIPNQELLQSEITNLDKDRMIRRRYYITTCYELPDEVVKKALLEEATKVEEVLKDPSPYVRLTEFKDYAIEYTLLVFLREIKKVPDIDAEIKETILKTCKNYNIDISTPRLILRLN